MFTHEKWLLIFLLYNVYKAEYLKKKYEGFFKNSYR